VETKAMLGYLFAFLGGFLLIFVMPFSLVSGYIATGIIFGVSGLLFATLALRLKTHIREVLLLFGVSALLLLFLAGLTDPGVGYNPDQSGMSMNGIITIEDAVNDCKSTGLTGWELVTYAQNLTARKFTYTRKYPWDTPERAFERGQGYCQQQALALNKIYDRLGINSWVVYTAMCRLPPQLVDGIYEKERITGHTWLMVNIQGKEMDVCPGSVNNLPGVTHFTVLSDVKPLNPVMQPITHIISTIINVMRAPNIRR
jgi:hypothetical protein